MLQGMHIAVVIPARNEEDHIDRVLTTLPVCVDSVVVVDDGSTDQTAKRAKKADSPCPVELIQLAGEGVGAAIDAGHQHHLRALDKPFISVVMAGDGQMNPDDLESLVQPLLSGEADHVKGNRMHHELGFNRMPHYRQRASKLLGFLTTLAAGQPFSDPQCGYTATSSTVLRSWDWNRSWKGYGYPNFWLVNLSKAGYRVQEVPVQSIYRNEISGIRPMQFFLTVGIMLAVEHHRRNLSWLRPRNLTPHTMFAFIAYVLGWSALLPVVSNDLEHELLARGVPALILGLLFWCMAHLFDRGAARVHRELRQHAPPR